MTKARRRKAAADAEPKEKIAIWLRPSLRDECRNAVGFLANGPEPQKTVSGLLEDALRRELDRLKRIHTGGRDFPKFRGRLVPGVRRKTAE